MGSHRNRKSKVYISVTDVVSVAWNKERGEVLKHLRGKKSRQKLAEEIADQGGECSHQNLKKLEYGKSESVSLKVLEAICLTLGISLKDFLSMVEVTE